MNVGHENVTWRKLALAVVFAAAIESAAVAVDTAAQTGAQSESIFAAPTAYRLQPTTYGLQPTTYGLQPTVSGLQPAECGYGPPPCQPRMTLFQWSYGTSFTGGPDLDEPLVTDRPDFTEASSTVGLGVAQIELGWTYTYDNDGAANTKSHSYPETLLRYGVLAEWFELRVAWNFTSEEAAGIHSRGSEHIYVGAKFGLTPQEGILPEMAIVPQMFVPTGSQVQRGDDVLGGVNWLYGWDVTERISTAGSTQFNRSIDDETGAGYTEWAQSWTIGYSLAERTGAYTEWYALFPHAADTARPEHYFNGGFTFLLSDDVQWDVRAGVGLNEAADDYFVGTGMAIRFK